MPNTAPLPFLFLAGHVALDFTNTVSWRRTGLDQERFDSYRRLVEWSRKAGLPVDVRELARRAASRPAAAARAIEEARRVRTELHQIFLLKAAGADLPKPLLDRFNRRLAVSLASLRLRPQDRDSSGAEWRLWEPGGLTSPVLWVLWEAASLLVSEETLKRCANPDCGWLYIDRSRRGNRRWCEMAVCGSRDKARRYYRRKRLRART